VQERASSEGNNNQLAAGGARNKRNSPARVAHREHGRRDLSVALQRGQGDTKHGQANGNRAGTIDGKRNKTATHGVKQQANQWQNSQAHGQQGKQAAVRSLELTLTWITTTPLSNPVPEGRRQISRWCDTQITWHRLHRQSECRMKLNDAADSGIQELDALSQRVRWKHSRAITQAQEGQPSESNKDGQTCGQLTTPMKTRAPAGPMFCA
jgi:hypothetical protein